MKYRNEPCQVGAEKYRSKRERDRHQELLLLQRAGKITELRREVPFELAPKVKIEGEDRARPAVKYIADFTYIEVPSGRRVVADAKGMQTTVYRLKKHLLKSIHGIDLIEI